VDDAAVDECETRSQNRRRQNPWPIGRGAGSDRRRRTNHSFIARLQFHCDLSPILIQLVYSPLTPLSPPPCVAWFSSATKPVGSWTGTRAQESRRCRPQPALLRSSALFHTEHPVPEGLRQPHCFLVP